MTKDVIHSSDAPSAIGPYSQAVRAGNTVYLSGQIGLDPKTGTMVEGLEAQAHQVFRNLRAIATAAGGGLDDVVKLSILVVDLGGFVKVNEIMATYFKEPFPARATYQVSALPRGGLIEVEAIVVLPGASGAASAQTGSRETFDQTKGQ
jgi:reactive intermediate/imine deaminase